VKTYGVATIDAETLEASRDPNGTAFIRRSTDA